MSMSDCIKCWNTPCDCGYEYRDWSWDRINEFVQTIISAKIEHEREKNESRNEMDNS
jgi:hypothetical protein